MNTNLTRQDVSAIARAITEATKEASQTGATLGHSKSIALIAKAIGYKDGNALMGTLKANEEQSQEQGYDPIYTPLTRHERVYHPKTGTTVTTGILDDGFIVSEALLREHERAWTFRPMAYRYDLRMTVISEEDLGETESGDFTLANLLWACDEGPAIAGTLDCRRRAISRSERNTLAIDFGSTPDFFLDEEEGEEYEDYNPEIAHSEGWFLQEERADMTGATYPELRRIDNRFGKDSVFQNDEEAITYVIDQAAAGSEYHQAILNLIRDKSEAEYDLLHHIHQARSKKGRNKGKPDGKNS